MHQTNDKPTLDRAIGDVQRLINVSPSGSTERLHAVAAMIQLENAADLLDKTERLLRLYITRDFDTKIHGAMQHDLCKNIEKLLHG
jgi:hypothetical protein